MKKINQVLTGIALFLVSTPAFAQMGAAAVDLKYLGTVGIGAGLGVGLAAAGAAYGQGKAASAALDGIGRNPSAAKPMFVPMLISLALMESLVIFAFVVNNNLGNAVFQVSKKVFGFE